MQRLNFKRLIIFSYDLLTIPLAWIAAFWVRDNLSSIPSYVLHTMFQSLPLVIIIQALSFWIFGLYRGEWRFASIPDMVRILKAVIVGMLAILVIYYFGFGMYIYQAPLPRSILPLYALILFFLLGGARMFYRWFREFRMPHHFRERALIVGAGLAGEGLARDLLRDYQRRYQPVGFVDDDRRKRGSEILGVRVLGSIAELAKLVKSYNINMVLIAMPSASATTMRNIVDMCSQAGVAYRTLPGLASLASGDVTINDLREVSLEDLLGREQVNLDVPALSAAFDHKTVLVTGGGGSIGSELCRQLAQFKLKELVIIEHSEFNLFQIEMDLKKVFPNLQLSVYLQSVIERDNAERIVIQHRPNVIFHAAAYKHVPLLEYQASVAIKNNLLGTEVMAKVAATANVEKFVLISTDKAVNPTNVMGTTKRLAEIFCQNYNSQVKTQFITVRFGNVLGSAGSVVPLFKQQLAVGGPITVTHPDMTRYFMTIPEASQLILQASVIGTGGEIFVLDMGEPVKITYLAEQMIKLSGKRVNEDIEIKFTGLRPGEKLYEELFHESEKLMPTSHEKIMQSQSRVLDWNYLITQFNELEAAAANNDLDTVRKIFKELVPENKITEN